MWFILIFRTFRWRILPQDVQNGALSQGMIPTGLLLANLNTGLPMP